eukprot:1622830-Ditylum_brightwellii.AAC.1
MTTNQRGIAPDPAPSSNNKPYRRNANHRQRSQQNANNRRYTPRVSKFEGRTAELKGHIYDAGYALQANLFVNTTRELAEYAGRTCNDSGDIRNAILEQKDVTFELPVLDDEFKKEDMKEIAAIIIQKEYD